jgi:cytochrome c2
MLVETAEDERMVLVFSWLLKSHQNLMPGTKVTIKGKKSDEDMLANQITYHDQA